MVNITFLVGCAVLYNIMMIYKAIMNASIYLLNTSISFYSFCISPLCYVPLVRIKTFCMRMLNRQGSHHNIACNGET